MKKIYFIYVLFLFTFPTFAQQVTVPFDTSRWEIVNGQLEKYLGRDAFQGIAMLKDVEFENGIIEVDIASTGARSYPGIFFRMQSENNYERFYIRPHHSDYSPNATQYVPVFNKVAGWQLYSGYGYTEITSIPSNVWTHLKMEIKDNKAQVYWNDSEEPVLVIPKLEHGISKGAIGLFGASNGAAYFSNFRYTKTDDLHIKEVEVKEAPENMIMDWELSKTYPGDRADPAKLNYPRFFSIFTAEWEKIKADENGLVNISKYRSRIAGKSDAVMARTFFKSDKKQTLKFKFGYSDEVAICLNGKKVFYANSSYKFRDPTFVGVVGLFDELYLDVEKGNNELMFMVKETFGGWGFMCQSEIELDKPLVDHSVTEKIWETSAEFVTPESATYDKERKVIYISSFDMRYKQNANPEDYTGFISKIDTDGNIIELKWVEKLHAPAGMYLLKDKLYVCERKTLAEIDVKTGEIQARYPYPHSEFINDVTADENGNIYITNTSNTLEDIDIYKFTNGKFETFLEGLKVHRSNGIFYHKGKLFVGNTGDGHLKSVEIETGKVDKIASLGAGVVDGIKITESGKYIVSQWEGKVYLIDDSGSVLEILDGMPMGINVADFEYIKEENLLIVPTFLGNKVVAFKIKE